MVKWVQNTFFFFFGLPVAEWISAAFNVICPPNGRRLSLKAKRLYSHLSACKCEIIYNKILSCWESLRVYIFPATLQEQKPAMTSEYAAESAKLFHTPPKYEK